MKRMWRNFFTRPF